jgi:glc operon protein GlcG
MQGAALVERELIKPSILLRQHPHELRPTGRLVTVGWARVRPVAHHNRRLTLKIATFIRLASCALALQFAASAQAQVPQYGADVTLEQARKAMAAAQAEARKNAWPVAIAIVDNAGQLVAFERMDNTQTASTLVAQDKAVSAAMYRRPTKAFQDLVAGGGAGTRALNLRGASTVEGGLPLVIDGKIIGGIGVSGVNSDQDGVVAKAGADATAAK